jgi:hypothetical protein
VRWMQVLRVATNTAPESPDKAATATHVVARALNTVGSQLQVCIITAHFIHRVVRVVRW